MLAVLTSRCTIFFSCGVGERLTHLHEYVEHAVRGDLALAPQDLLQRRSIHVLHGDVVAAVLLTGVVHRDDVRVVQLRCALGLTKEVPERLRVLLQRVGQDLVGHDAVEDGVPRLIDDAHSAPSELADDLVATRLPGRLEAAHGDGG